MNTKMIKRFVLGAGLMGSLLCGFVGQAQANVYTNNVNFTTGNVLTGSGEFNWSHAITADFQIPFDTLNSASLVIHSQRAAGGNDDVFAINLAQMLTDLGPLGANGNSDFTTTLTIPNGVFTAGWTSGKALQLSLHYNQGTGNNNTLTMLSSFLTLDYTNQTGTGSNGTVPEPAPVALLGMALAGLLMSKRRKQ